MVLWLGMLSRILVIIVDEYDYAQTLSVHGYRQHNFLNAEFVKAYADRMDELIEDEIYDESYYLIFGRHRKNFFEGHAP